jgi:hypothetical protein
MKKRFFRLVIVFFGLISLTPFTSNAADPEISYELLSKSFKDIRPSEESDFRPVFDKVRSGINPVLTDNEIKRLEKWLDSKQDLIRLFDRAIKKNSIQYPVMDITSMEVLNFGDFKDAIVLKKLQAEQYLNDGHSGDAIDSILDAVKYGRMIASGENAQIIHYMAGSAFESKSLKWLESLLCRSRHDRGTLQRVLNAIPDKNIADSALVAAFTIELNSYAIPIIEMISSQIEPVLTELKMNHPPIFDKDDSVDLVSGLFKKVIENTTTPWPKRDKKISADFQNDFRKENPDREGLEDWMLSLLVGEKIDNFDINNKKQVAEWKKLERLSHGKKNVLGRTLLGYSLLDFNGFIERSIQVRTRSNLIRTLTAMKIFYDNHGRYPKNLHELVATGILDRVPVDLFSNQPLYYSAGNHKIWSVGKDEKNNGGDSDKDMVASVNRSKAKGSKEIPNTEIRLNTFQSYQTSS